MFRNIGRLLNWIGLAAIVAPMLGGAIYAGVDKAKYSGLFGEVWVIDGNTIDIGRQRYRLYGIDAPEAEQQCQDAAGRGYACGQAAVAALAALVKDQTVSCEERDRDQYKRIVAICYAGGYDLGYELVRQGHAIAYTRFTRQYVPQEREAKAAKRGVWSGSFVEPEAWRAQRRH